LRRRWRRREGGEEEGEMENRKIRKRRRRRRKEGEGEGEGEGGGGGGGEGEGEREGYESDEAFDSVGLERRFLDTRHCTLIALTAYSHNKITQNYKQKEEEEEVNR